MAESAAKILGVLGAKKGGEKKVKKKPAADVTKALPDKTAHFKEKADKVRMH